MPAVGVLGSTGISRQFGQISRVGVCYLTAAAGCRSAPVADGIPACHRGTDR